MLQACNDESPVQLIATDYLRRRWNFVPVPYRSKAPIYPGWQQLRITEADLGDHFTGHLQNIGVLLGEPSRWLIDVDLDHELAIELSASYLPSTGAVFGRASKRRSHWLYYATHPVATRQWRLPDKKMAVELRSTGGQTIFPGSIHPSGEPVEWDVDGKPAIVDPAELEAALGRLYRAVATRLQFPHKDHSTRWPVGPLAPIRIVERARRYLAKLPPAVSGQGGHDATFCAACRLVIGFGLDRDDALSLLRRWNETHCQPPWTERELVHKVDDALKEPGWRGYLLSTADHRYVFTPTSAIDRANRHAIEHRRRARRGDHA